MTRTVAFPAVSLRTRRLSSYQPQYFPRLHYFARMLDADVFTISDYLQYVRKHALHDKPDTGRVFSYQAHAPIKARGSILLLDIPVRKGGIDGKQPLNAAQIDYSTDWQRKTINLLRTHYPHAPQYGIIMPSLSAVIRKRYASLAEYTIATTLWALHELLDIPSSGEKNYRLTNVNTALPHGQFRLKKIVLMSETGIEPADKRTRDANDWLVETCQKFDAHEYYFGGTAARAYMDFNRYRDAQIALVEQRWRCEPYPQLHGEFVPNLSIIDLLMNVSPQEARNVLQTEC